MKIMIALALLTACASKKEAPPAAKGSAAPVAPKEAPTPTPPPIDASPPDATEVPIAVSAKQIYADYESNEVSADDKYKGRLLEVTGIISKIAKSEFDDKPRIQVSAGDRFGLKDVWAYPAADDAWLPKLKKGQKVIMQCRGDGVSLTVPALKDCAIEHVFERQ